MRKGALAPAGEFKCLSFLIKFTAFCECVLQRIPYRCRLLTDLKKSHGWVASIFHYKVCSEQIIAAIPAWLIAL